MLSLLLSFSSLKSEKMLSILLKSRVIYLFCAHCANCAGVPLRNYSLTHSLHIVITGLQGFDVESRWKKWEISDSEYRHMQRYF